MIKNIILDLGGVILDVDYNRAVEAFKRLDIPDFHTLYSQQKQDLLFDKFEKGEISDTDFRGKIRQWNPLLTDEQIDNAWNAMIMDSPAERLKFLVSLKTKYRLFLLSNTNEIHIRFFIRYYNDHFGAGFFDSLFEKIYLSSNLGMRKPELQIFNHVVSENNLITAETIFIDDSPQHIEGAQKAGLHAVLLPKGEKIEQFLVPIIGHLELTA